MSRPAPTPLAAEVDPAHPNLAERVRAEQIRMVYLHSPTTTGGSLVAGAFLIAVMWNTVSHAASICSKDMENPLSSKERLTWQ